MFFVPSDEQQTDQGEPLFALSQKGSKRLPRKPNKINGRICADGQQLEVPVLLIVARHMFTEN